MTECDRLKAKLCEAEDALHALRTGGKTKAVAYGDKSVTYSDANIGDLRAYVFELQGRVATACGTCRPVGRRMIQMVPR